MGNVMAFVVECEAVIPNVPISILCIVKLFKKRKMPQLSLGERNGKLLKVFLA